eukprot:CAMPEP_0196661090 /NCGR_PEP_ID=MMETSP1086-20130531/42580_1 /TAXON_ID=77921 /ORGANISM="Cyanoptyche  gloeocystis , Strain SAG4.97" /LENGTH=202 /DNA_ID=CAMNT_0041995831 /DNA_START=189 /DNA_END=797 /DNA_ORIENTATION=+
MDVGVGRLAGEHLIQKNSEGVHVDSKGDGLTAEYLWCCVGRTADGACLGQLGVHDGTHAEVNELDSPRLGQHDIGGFKVTMDDISRVDVLQPHTDLQCQLDYPRSWWAPSKRISQGTAIDVLEDKMQSARIGGRTRPGSIERRNTGMGKQLEDANFLAELSQQRLSLRSLIQQQRFQGNLAAQPRAAVHDSGGAPPNDLIAS